MAEITAQLVQQLRQMTGLGMAKCKEALVHANGDIEKAIEHLRKIGLSAGAKKGDREAKEGIIVIADDSHAVVVLEGNTETDFVANNERFKTFMHDVLTQAQKTKPASLADLLAQPFQKDPSITVEQARNLIVAALQENIQLRRLEVIKKEANHSYGVYSHGNKLVVVVDIEGAADQSAVAKDVAMHVAATNPDYLSAAEIPADVVEKEKEIAREQVKGKPENIMEKIVAGKLKAREDEICLVNQKFVKNPDETVQQYVDSCGKQIGKTLTLRSFKRWRVGQA